MGTEVHHASRVSRLIRRRLDRSRIFDVNDDPAVPWPLHDDPGSSKSQTAMGWAFGCTSVGLIETCTFTHAELAHALRLLLSSRIDHGPTTVQRSRPVAGSREVNVNKWSLQSDRLVGGLA